jgi:hypothetical protein
MLTLCDHTYGESRYHRLGFATREKSTELLKRRAGQRLHGTEVADQSGSRFSS